MKKLILALVLIIAFAIPVLADDFSGTVTVGVDYLSTGEIIDTAEFAIETDISDDLAVSVTLNVDELVFGTPAVSVDGKLKFAIDEGETAEIGVNLDVITSDVEVYGQYKGLPIADDMLLNAKIQGAFPADTYYAVATLIYDIDEDIDLIVEARYDSDGAEIFSAGVELSYAVSENIDVKVGYEFNDWEDGINDWDCMNILSDVNTAYVELVFRF